ncbi:MAG: phage tail tape measure protein [Aquamicrobium sp.]|nr:phage tail tape measure protein [Aquamicrobium sp.]
MNADIERLIVSVEARTRDLEKNMAKASKVFGGGFGQIEKRAKLSGDRLEKTMGAAAARVGGVFKNFGVGLLGGIAAGGVAGIVGQFGQIAKGIAQIGDEAKRAGVSNRVFQEWATVAEQARIPVDAMIDGLKELSLRGDEFALTGKGSAAEAFERLGYTAEELKRKLADPSTLLLEIIDRLGKFDKAAQIRISDELFGGSAGERFVELLDQGAAGIRRTIDEAHRLGNILSDDVITRAAEVDRQFQIVSQTVGTALKGAIVNAASALQQFIDSFRNFEDQQAASLDAQLATIGKQQMDLENKILKLKGEQSQGGMFARDVTGDIQYLEEERAALLETEAQIVRVIEARRKARENAATPPGTSFTPPPYTPPPSSGGASRDASASKIERERQAVADLIAELEEELRLVGATDAERRAAEASRRAGAAATDDERQRIIALNEAIHQENAALDAQQQRLQGMADTARDFIGGFRADIMNGVPPLQALGNAIGRLSDRIFDELLTAMFEVQNAGGGFGGIFGWLGKLFGFAGGGQINASQNTPVLRRAGGGMIYGPGGPTDDRIPVLASDGEFMVNAAATRKHRAILEAINSGSLPRFAGGGLVGGGSAPLAAGVGGQVISISAPVTVNGSAGTPEQNEDLARRTAKNMEATMRGVVMDEIRRQTRPGNYLNTRAR